MSISVALFIVVCMGILIAILSRSSLSQKFKALGNMTNKSKDEIIQAVGLPTSISSVGGGYTLLQWQRDGYHIAIQFDERNIFAGITHEFSAR